jgi:hypothetical protein
MVVVELYALVVGVFSLGCGVYFRPPELEAGGSSVIKVSTKAPKGVLKKYIWCLSDKLVNSNVPSLS